MNSTILNNNASFSTPWYTWFISILVVTQYFLINFNVHFGTIDMETFTLFGAPDTVDIYRGQYWGVFTNNFIYNYWKPLVLNLVLLWFFGAFIERRIGFARMFLLIILACTIPSVWQLTLTSEPGIGLAGVNYTLFGYILVKSKDEEIFRLSGKTIFLIGMIVELLYCNYYNFFVENTFRTEAMTAGLILGLLLGKISVLKMSRRMTAVSGICIVSFSTLFYAPWSAEWQIFKGVQCHELHNYSKAKKYYHQALSIDSSNPIAKKNLDLLAIDHLKSKAYKAHFHEKYDLAKKYYQKILRLDPKDTWARENLNELP